MANPDEKDSLGNTRQGNDDGWFKSKWYKPLGQFFELASVIVLVCLLGVAWLPLSPGAKVLIAVADLVVAACLFGGAIICLSRAIEESRKAAAEFTRQADSTTHVISDARLLVLKEEKVARDAFEVLRRLNNSALSFDGVNGYHSESAKSDGQPGEVAYTAVGLIAELRKGLGRARTNEVQELVLKYTVRDEDLAGDSVDSPAQRP